MINNRPLRLIVLLAALTALDALVTPAQAQSYRHRGDNHSRGSGFRYRAPARGYYFGNSYQGGGRYGRPWGYSSSFGYAPGRGNFYSNSYYGSGFGYSTYGGYYR